MTYMHYVNGQLVGRRCGSVGCPFVRLIRRSDPQSPSHSTAAVPDLLADLEKHVSTPRRTEGAAEPVHRPGQWPAELDRMRASRHQRERVNRPKILYSQFREAVAAILADQPSPRCVRTAAHRLITEITFMSGDAIRALDDGKGSDR